MYVEYFAIQQGMKALWQNDVFWRGGRVFKILLLMDKKCFKIHLNT